jgi:hypothetical protein
LDSIAGASDRSREADAVLSVTDVVVHRFRNGNDLDAEFVELGRIAERVVAADRDQMFDAERREVRQHLLGDIPGLLPLGAQGGRKVLGDELSRQLAHPSGIGSAGVQHGDVMRPTARVLDVQMRERLPATTDTKNLDVVLAATVGSALDYGVEARNIAGTGKNTDTLYSH